MNNMTDFDETIYHDEPLRRPDKARRQQILPQEIIDMRKLAQLYPTFSLRRECFYRQALMMQDYEDSYIYFGHFDSWYPTYEDMDNEELRGYFTWRKVMRWYLEQFLTGKKPEIKTNPHLFSQDPGQELAAHLSYLYLFIYELLEGIHVTDPEEGLRQLECLRGLYGPYSRGLENNLRNWIGHYCIYYNLNREKAGEYLLTDKSRAINCLRDLEMRYIKERHAIVSGESTHAEGGGSAYADDGGVVPAGGGGNIPGIQQADIPKRQQADSGKDVKALCDAVGILLGKPLKSSIFCARNEKRAQEIFFRVYMETGRYLADNHKPMLLESCAGMHTTFPVHMFGAAVWYDWKRPDAYVYRLDENHAYRCSCGVWQIETYESEVMPTQRRQNLLSALWHETDRLMRIRYNFGHPLSSSQTGAMFMPLILKVIAAYQREEERGGAAAGENNVIPLAESEQQILGENSMNPVPAESEQQILGENSMNPIPAESEQQIPGENNINPAPPASALPAEEPAVHLNEQQREFLIRLLDNSGWQEYVRSEHLVLSILIDEINDAFYEAIGDTVIEQDGSDPVIIEDYREDVRSACTAE